MIARLEAVLIFLASFALAAFVIAKRTFVESYLGAIGFAAYPIAVVVFALVASAPFSVTDALAVMNGVIFGPLWGSVVNVFGIVLAAIVGYVIAMRTSKLLDLEAQIEKLPSWVRRFRIGSPAFLIMVRVIPGIGGTVATQTAAALKVPIIVHIWTMAVVAVPVCTALAIFGDGAARFVDQRFVEPTKAYVNRHHPHFPHAVRPTVAPR